MPCCDPYRRGQATGESPQCLPNGVTRKLVAVTQGWRSYSRILRKWPPVETVLFSARLVVGLRKPMAWRGSGGRLRGRMTEVGGASPQPKCRKQRTTWIRRREACRGGLAREQPCTRRPVRQAASGCFSGRLYHFGGKDEAADYVDENGPAWHATPGAIAVAGRDYPKAEPRRQRRN